MSTNRMDRDRQRPMDSSPFLSATTVAEERRLVPRFVTLEYRSWLGWRQGTTMIATAARLLDISQAGIAVEAEDLPPTGVDIWFCLSPGEDRDCVAGEVVGSEKGARGRYRIRIAFWAPCPARLFHEAIHGLASRSAATTNASARAFPDEDTMDHE